MSQVQAQEFESSTSKLLRPPPECDCMPALSHSVGSRTGSGMQMRCQSGCGIGQIMETLQQSVIISRMMGSLSMPALMESCKAHTARFSSGLIRLQASLACCKQVMQNDKKTLGRVTSSLQVMCMVHVAACFCMLLSNVVRYTWITVHAALAQVMTESLTANTSEGLS